MKKRCMSVGICFKSCGVVCVVFRFAFRFIFGIIISAKTFRLKICL